MLQQTLLIHQHMTQNQGGVFHCSVFRYHQIPCFRILGHQGGQNTSVALVQQCSELMELQFSPAEEVPFLSLFDDVLGMQIQNLQGMPGLSFLSRQLRAAVVLLAKVRGDRLISWRHCGNHDHTQDSLCTPSQSWGSITCTLQSVNSSSVPHPQEGRA